MSNLRTVFIGEAPSRAADRDALERAKKYPELEPNEFAGRLLTKLALTGPAGRTLARCADVEFHFYLNACERRNLLNRWPGSNGRGSAFPLREANRVAVAMMPALNGRRVVLLGKRVARAFWVETDYLKWAGHTYRHPDRLDEVFAHFHVAVVPHPSRINRWWNDAQNLIRARAFLRDALNVEEVH